MSQTNGTIKTKRAENKSSFSIVLFSFKKNRKNKVRDSHVF